MKMIQYHFIGETESMWLAFVAYNRHISFFFLTNGLSIKKTPNIRDTYPNFKMLGGYLPFSLSFEKTSLYVYVRISALKSYCMILCMILHVTLCMT